MTRPRKVLWASWSLYAALSVVYTILASFNDKALRSCELSGKSVHVLSGLGAFLHTLLLNLRVAIIGRQAEACGFSTRLTRSCQSLLGEHHCFQRPACAARQGPFQGEQAASCFSRSTDLPFFPARHVNSLPHGRDRGRCRRPVCRSCVFSSKLLLLLAHHVAPFCSLSARRLHPSPDKVLRNSARLQRFLL